MKVTIIGCGNAGMVHAAKLIERHVPVCLLKTSTVSQTEFFSGGRLGLQPSLKATIYDFEYNNEPIVKVHYSDTTSKLYSVYRTYSVGGSDKLELYLEERGGTKDEPSTDGSSSEHSD